MNGQRSQGNLNSPNPAILKNALIRLGGAALRRKLDLAKYRKIMSYPMWNYLNQAIVRTRSYDSGLNGGLLLLRYTEEYRDKLTKKERESNLMKLYGLTLRMLDKLDRWDEYLAAWEDIRSHTNFEVTYIKEARNSHGARFEPFILREDAHTLYVHFLWGTLHRKELIQRKFARKQQGKRLGNLLHAHQAELTAEEIKRRLDWIIEIAEMNMKRSG